MRPSRLIIFGSVFTALALLPTFVEAQDCTWCYQCDAPLQDRVYTDDNAPGPDLIASPLGDFACRTYEVADCPDLIECPPSEEDDAQVAELIALIDGNDVKGLSEAMTANPEKYGKVTERSLLLFRGSCGLEVVAVFELETELFARLEEAQPQT